VKWPWSRSKQPEHMTRAEKKRIAELIDEGLGDTAISRAVNRSRTTIYRYRWTLQQERANTAVEKRTVELQRQLVETFVKSIENLNLRPWLLGLSALPEDARLSVLAYVTSEIDVEPEELLQFDRWLKTAAKRWRASRPSSPRPKATPPPAQAPTTAHEPPPPPAEAPEA